MAANQKIIRKLRRELTVNPKKSAILGLLLLVAVWFWAPLVTKWFAGNSDAAAKSVKSVTAGFDAEHSNSNVANSGGTGSDTATEGGVAKSATPTWHQVLTWIQNDPIMQPHMAQGEQRDPFAPAKSRLAAEKDTRQAAAPTTVELAPAQAGIALHSTVVSSQMKTALINGRVYHENQVIAAPNGQDHFVLVEIRADRVVLGRHGQSFEVKLKTVEFAKTND